MRLKSIMLAFSTLLCRAHLTAQNLDDFNADRLKRTQKGMLVLGSWATANIISSPILANNTSGSDKYFHQMNGYWNGVNLVIAGLGYLGARKSMKQRFTLTESLKERQKLEKALLFNAGLDIGYMLGGLYLIERSKNDDSNADRFEGFGQSLILQGGFLFTFDVIFYLVQKKHGQKLFNFVDNLAFSPTGFRISLKL